MTLECKSSERSRLAVIRGISSLCDTDLISCISKISPSNDAMFLEIHLRLRISLTCSLNISELKPIQYEVAVYTADVAHEMTVHTVDLS